MTHAAARHRNLDRRAALAAGEPAGHGLVASRLRMRDMRTMQTSQARVLLAELTECVSSRGNRYLKGSPGASSLVVFTDDSDAEGRTWKLFLTERPPRSDSTPPARQRPSGNDAGSASTEETCQRWQALHGTTPRKRPSPSRAYRRRDPARVRQ